MKHSCDDLIGIFCAGLESWENQNCAQAVWEIRTYMYVLNCRAGKEQGLCNLYRLVLECRLSGGSHSLHPCHPITVPVPSGATTGTVVVTINGVASNGVRIIGAKNHPEGATYRKMKVWQNPGTAWSFLAKPQNQPPDRRRPYLSCRPLQSHSLSG